MPQDSLSPAARQRRRRLFAGQEREEEELQQREEEVQQREERRRRREKRRKLVGGGGGAAVRTQPVRQAGSMAVRADARMGRREVGLGGLQKNNIARSGRGGDCGDEVEPVRPTRSMVLEERTRKHAIRCSCRSSPNSPCLQCAQVAGARWHFFLLGFIFPRGSDVGGGAHQVLTHSTVRNLTDVCRRASRTRCSWALFSIAGVIHKPDLIIDLVPWPHSWC